MNDQEAVRRARGAKDILENALWIEAWDAYRLRLLTIIETADSNNTELVMQAKRLLTAGATARAYLELLVKDGAISAETIKLDEEREKRKKWWQVA